MDGVQKEIMLKEIKNFKQISKKYNYKDINELIGHYIEEDIINSKDELAKVINLIRNKRGISINIKNFQDCWAN